jgi:predicted dehydrogenase
VANLNRRNFLKRAAVVAGATAGAQYLGAPLIIADGKGPNDTLGFACIGCGGQGTGNPGWAASKGRLVAMVEVDDGKMADAAKKLGPKAEGVKQYFDFRKMLDECHKDIDCVLIATPDHTHAPAAMRSMKLGKHVFVQKPMAHDIWEARQMAELAKEKKVMTQMGNQGHCGEGYRRLCEYIWGGAIGKVTEVHCWFNRNFGGNSPRPATKPVPPGVHWDEWLGPAAFREFHDGLHPFSWRNFWDFGTGTLGDMGCHIMDGACWSLKLKHADSVEAIQSKGGNKDYYPQNNIVKWSYPARGDMPPVTIFGNDDKPEIFKEWEKKANREFKGGGSIYVGDKGVMYTETYGDGVRILPEEAHKAFPPPEKSIPRVKGGPLEDLLQAIKGGTPPCSNFVDYAGYFAEMVLLGRLAMRAGVGKKVDWDGPNMKTSVAGLEDVIKREYRKGWEW